MKTLQRFPALLLSGLMGTAALPSAKSADRVVVTAPALPSVQEIVQRAVANDERRHEHRLSMECDQLLTTQHLDAQGTVTKTKTAHVVHREGAEFAYFAKGDSPAAHLASRDGDTTKAEHSMAAMNLSRLAPRFDYALEQEAQVQGRTCYVVAFMPKRGQQADGKEQKVIDQLHGRFWIDEKTSEILQGEGSLAAPVGVGLLASVQAMSFSFHDHPLPSGEVAPADFRVEYTIKAPFYFFHQRQDNQLQNWRSAQ